jgi:uncharacterized protein (DUF2236 family)
VGNTPVTPFLGGGTAVLLQVAHPLVAAGVAAHSDYRNDLWRRLARTLRSLYLITYGTKAEADRAGASVQAVHARVRGATSMQLGRFPAGTPYSADDPELMLWVHATLVYASLAAYQRFERPLPDDEQEAYYRDMKTVAGLFGTPPEILPPRLTDFRGYFEAQLSGDTLAVTPLAEDIARVILKAPLPAPLRLLAPAHRLATAAQLPPALRREFGLRWTPFHPPLLALAGGALRVAGWPILRTAGRLRLTPATA